MRARREHLFERGHLLSIVRYGSTDAVDPPPGTPAGRHGAAFGVYNAALGVGTLAASVLFGVLYERFGAGAAFGTGAGLAAVAASGLLVVRMVPSRDAKMEDSDVSHSRHQ
jgi:MFS family permease